MSVNEQSCFSFMNEKSNDTAPCDVPEDMDKKIGKKVRTKKRENAHGNKAGSDRCLEWYSDPSIDSNSVTGGILHRTKSRTKHVISGTRASTSNCTNLSNFREPGLDGCLGGF